MRGKNLLEKMALIDPKYIEAADKMPPAKKSAFPTWIAAAACICLMLTCALALPHLTKKTPDIPIPSLSDVAHGDTTKEVLSESESSSEPPQTTESDTDIIDAPNIPYAKFNNVTSAMDAARAYIPGYFTEPLDISELAAIIPEEYITASLDRLADTAGTHGTAGFNGDGELVDVSVAIFIPESKKIVYLSIGMGRPYFEFDSETVSYLINGVYFTLFEWEQSNDKYLLGAYGTLNGEKVYLKIITDSENIEADKKELVSVIDKFAAECASKPDLSAITPDSIPEFFDRQLTLTEAKADADFGEYVTDAPDGFVTESVQRYKDQDSDYLSVLFTKGLDQLDVRIYKLSGADRERVVSVDNKAHYDLTFYPIPRAESVPDELRDIVNNPVFKIEELTLEAVASRMYVVGDEGDTEGPRCHFSVLYGDTVVEIGAKGVYASLIFELLSNIE